MGNLAVGIGNSIFYPWPIISGIGLVKLKELLGQGGPKPSYLGVTAKAPQIGMNTYQGEGPRPGKLKGRHHRQGLLEDVRCCASKAL